jgi:hypothetical protein
MFRSVGSVQRTIYTSWLRVPQRVPTQLPRRIDCNILPDYGASMKVVWCWRCNTDYPMLKDHEWSVLMDAHTRYGQQDRDAAFDVIKRYAADHGLRTPIEPSLERPVMARAFWYLVSGFELFTGILEDSPNPISHYYISHYGPPCNRCGRLLRTKLASHCAACGEPSSDSNQTVESGR